MKKKWQVEFYHYNLVESEVHKFYTKVGAKIYMWYIERFWQFKCYFREI